MSGELGSNFSWLQGHEPFYTWAVQAETALCFAPRLTMTAIRSIAERLQKQSTWDERVARLLGTLYVEGSRAGHGSYYSYDDALAHLKSCRSCLLAYYKKAVGLPDYLPPRFVNPATLLDIGRHEWLNFISERTKTALQRKKAQGIKLGAPRYENPAALRRIQELSEMGLTQRAICDRLNQEQVPTQKGGPWVRSTIAKLQARL